MSEMNNNEEFEINTNSKHICDKCHQQIKEEKPQEKMDIEKETKENEKNIEKKNEKQKVNKKQII